MVCLLLLWSIDCNGGDRTEVGLAGAFGGARLEGTPPHPQGRRTRPWVMRSNHVLWNAGVIARRRVFHVAGRAPGGSTAFCGKNASLNLRGTGRAHR